MRNNVEEKTCDTDTMVSILASVFKLVLFLQLSTYLHEAQLFQFGDRETRPMEYWSMKLPTTLKPLAEFAITLLSCPASSASVERMFSLAAIVQSGKRLHINAETTDSELMIK